MKLDISQLSTTLVTRLKPVVRYRILFFVLLVVGLYAYLVVQINQATSVQPATNQPLISTKKSLKVDESTVQQLEQLQDNSVSVQSLFNEARTNPFE